MSESLSPILLAEDEESDRMLFQLAIRKANVRHPLIIACDGQAAVDYLDQIVGDADCADRPLPAIIILDLKMPRMTGFDVLAWLLVEKRCKEIPAVVMSSSSDESDIKKTMQLGARDYFVKPHDFQELINTVRKIQVRWLGSGSEFVRNIDYSPTTASSIEAQL